MSKLSDLLELIELEYPDHVKIPDYWNELIARLEDVLVRGMDIDAGVAIPGDLKVSARDADHGRWLKLDGRSLSQAEIEAALGLEAGEAEDFVTLMGTGGASKYGAAAAGKVKLKDARRKFPLGAGAAGDGDGSLTARPLDNGGGAETHKLTSNQSGVKAHGHAVTDPEHTHGKTDPGHSHGASQAAHSHRSSTGSYFLIGPGGSGDGTNTQATMAGGNNGAVQETDKKTPSITVNDATTGITINKAKTGVTIQNAVAADAAEAHNNMPPFEVLGYWFIRV